MSDPAQTPDPTSGVDVIIPVYGAPVELDQCLASLVRNTAFPPNRLILVIDGPQDETVETVLKPVAGGLEDGILVIRNRVRAGFVASVNHGMRASDRDVILLNSDTKVTARWAEKLRAAAYSSPTIATVTPLSNNATICSIPEFLADNLLPAGISPDAMSDAVERVSVRQYPRLPTGVGVCLYIKRAALDSVGLFDERSFGLGYGEENEFCVRANAAGWEHIADDATFVYHAGQKSFGADTARRVRSAMRKLRSVDSTYVSRVAAFIESDPLAGVRKRVLAEINRGLGVAAPKLTEHRLSILHIVHGWPPFASGGTEQYAYRLAMRQNQRHQVSVFARLANDDRLTGQRAAYLDRGIRVRLVINNFDRRNPIARNALKDRDVEREFEIFLRQTGPDLVHVHHLAGHCASLMGVVARRKIPIVYQVQDWWPLCPRSNLWRPDGSLCCGPSASRCARCLPLTSLPPRMPLNRMLHRFRRQFMKRQLRLAAAYVMGSYSISSWYTSAGFFAPQSKVHVLEYGVPGKRGPAASPRRVVPPIIFGYIGALMPHKGAHVAVEAFREMPPDKARLVLWGNPDADPAYTAHLRERATAGVIDFMGSFEEERRTEVLASLDVLIVPSVGLESFGIAAREAMAAGVPVLASRRGALEELNIDGTCGATFEAEDADALRRVVDGLVEEPSTLEAWRRSLPAVATVEEHAEAVEDIYAQVLREFE